METSTSNPTSPSLPHPLFSPSYHPRRFTQPKPLAGAAKPRGRRKPDYSGQPKACPPCTECGRRFSSWKALFGHMRCHPERGWRGMNPQRPQRTKSPRPQFTDEEYQVAATLLLLANGPPLEIPSGEISGAVIIRSLPSLDGSIRRKKERRFGAHFSPSSSSASFCCSQDRECLLDLNMPPPLEAAEVEISPALELKLGI